MARHSKQARGVLSIAGPIRRVRSFLAIYARVVTEALLPQKKLLCGVVVLDILSAAALGGVIGGLVYFVDFMEGDRQSISIAGVEIEKNFLALALLGGGVFLLLVGSAWTGFYSSLLNRLLARRHQVRTTARVLDAFRNWHTTDFAASAYTERDVVQCATRYSRHAGMAAEKLARLVQPTAYILTATAIVFALDPYLTLALIPVTALVAPFVYRQSARIHRDAKRFYDTLARAMGRAMSGMIATSNSSNITLSDRKSSITALDSPGPFQDFLDGLDRNRLASDRMSLVVSSFRAFFFAFVVLVFGYYAHHGMRSWGMMIGFVGGLFYLMNGVQIMLVHLAKLNRFYPQVRSLYEFFDAGAGYGAGEMTRDTIEIEEIDLCAAPKLAGSLSQSHVRCGDWVAYDSSAPLTRVSFVDFVRPLRMSSDAPGDFWANADFVSSRFRPTGMRIRDVLGGFSAGFECSEGQEAALRNLGILEVLRALPQGLDAQITDELWEDLRPSVRALLQVAILPHGSGRAVFLDAKTIKNLAPEARRKLPELLAGRFVFVASAWDAIPDLDIRLFVIAKGDTIAGMGDRAWFNGVKDMVKRRIERDDDITAEDFVDDDEDF